MQRSITALLLTLKTLVALARQRAWEPLLVWFSVATACAGLTAVALINDNASQSISKPPALAFHYVVSAKQQSQPPTQHDYALLRRAGFTQLAAFVQFDTYVKEATETVPISVIAFDSTALPPGLSPAAGLADASGYAPAGMNPHLAARLSNATSVEVKLPHNQWQHFAAVMHSAVPDNTVVIDIAQFYASDRSLNGYPLSGMAWIGKMNKAKREALNTALPSHLTLTEQFSELDQGSVPDSFKLNLWAMGMLMALVCLFIIINALHLMYRARLATLIRLRQLGVSANYITLSLLLEMLLLTGLASAAGVILGFQISHWVSPALSQTFSSLFNAAYQNQSQSLVIWFLPAWLISALAVALVAMIPLRKLKASLQLRRAPTPVYVRGLLPIAVVLWILSGLIFLLIPTTTGALTGIATVLLAGCTLMAVFLPALLAVCSRVIPARWPVWHWSFHSAVALSLRTRLAACAFFIALTANVGMNVMVDSFRQATESWLSQRLFAQAYLYTAAPQEAIKQAPEGLTLIPRYAAAGTINNAKVEVRSFPTEAQFQKSLLTDSTILHPWRKFIEHTGLFVSQQTAYRLNLKTGQTVQLSFAGETQKDYTVIGIYPDYGNPASQVLLPPDQVSERGEINGAIAIMGQQMSQADIQQWANTLDASAKLYDTDNIMALSLAEFDRTFVITDALNVVTLLVAALSFLMSVALLSLDTRPQLSLLRALGVRSLAIRFGLLGQYLLILVFCTLMAIPAGILLSWLLVDRVNRYAFYWTYPLVIDPIVMVQSAAISIGLLMVLLSLPVGKLSSKINTREAMNVD
ncbi:ABC transporter permease [Alteromonas pelagimontana]|uniref:ABC transporter permease n=1 Tax=Alteromonas pelagimontana TaxID=1858656 RepID=A0A6M4MFR6_9ALTE|nr:ABC transporter permease [Alteromonas pelagimontana]QJR82004.1 ABC transporter permease [Alteromonas pelagimontana]